MTAILDEHKNWQTAGGKPLINGSVYFGVRNEDAKIDMITIYSDSALQNPTTNPQITDSFGQTAEKIYVADFYSIIVEDEDENLIYSNLDNGSGGETGAPIVLENVSGANDLLAQGTTIVTEYIDGQIYVLKTVLLNTDSMTLDIDDVGPKPIKFNFNEEIKPGFFQALANIEVMYNGSGAPTSDHFLWLNSGRGISLLTDVLGDGNTITAEGGPSTVAYVDKQLYIFKQNITNPADNVTLKIGTLLTHSIKTNGEELAAGELLTDKLYIVAYNAQGTVFDLVSNIGRQGLVSQQVFTANGTWNKPTGINRIKVICTGGGGGGGGNAAAVNAGGGGAGATAIKLIVNPALSYGVAVGAGGAAPASTTGTAGGASVVGGSIVSANGGGGGVSGGAGGVGNSTGIGDYVLNGGDGLSGSTGGSGNGGAGGASFHGGGGKGGAGSAGPGVGKAYGSGGGGSVASSNVGAVGKSGIIIIEEYA